MSVNADILKKDRVPVWVVFGIKLLGFAASYEDTSRTSTWAFKSTSPPLYNGPTLLGRRIWSPA